MNTTTSGTTELTAEEERLIRTMQLLGDKTRYKLCKLLMTRNELCVSQIADELNISVSAVSQHFKSFELLGLVDKERKGQKICYLLKPEDTFVKELLRVIDKK